MSLASGGKRRLEFESRVQRKKINWEVIGGGEVPEELGSASKREEEIWDHVRPPDRPASACRCSLVERVRGRKSDGERATEEVADKGLTRLGCEAKKKI